MKLKLIWVGKTKSAAIKELIAEYLGRLARFVQVEVAELRDLSGASSERLIEKESKSVLSRIDEDPFVVVLDERGRQIDSFEMARFLEEHGLAGTKQITFVIGGFAGVSGELKKRANLVLALSRMTLTHEFARALLVEQLYRAYTIMRGLPYQK